MAVPSVPFDVRIELGLPEFPARARCRRVRAAGVPVPEAAVHEAHGTETTKHEVGCPRKSAVVQTESKTACMDGSTQGEFGPLLPIPAIMRERVARSTMSAIVVAGRSSEGTARQQATREVRAVMQRGEMLRRRASPRRFARPRHGDCPALDGGSRQCRRLRRGLSPGAAATRHRRQGG